VFKRALVRLLLFGIPFTAAYLHNRPAPVVRSPTFVVPAYVGRAVTQPDGKVVIVVTKPEADKPLSARGGGL
jgi:hypothetical protein